MTIENSPYDLVIVGGGINGAGIARDAAGRGLKVLLCEQDDLASHTSSASTKLVHGGLRYLEHYAFGLVRKALREREVLLRAAPHLIRPMRFVMPHSKGLRPRWMLRAGLFLYDHLGGRKLLPGSHGINLRSHIAGDALQRHLLHAYEYSDCWVDDARLVVLNARAAAEQGARIMTRTACVAADRGTTHWTVHLRSTVSGREFTATARALVNAAGPWVSRLLAELTPASHRRPVRLVKGSHVVVPRLFAHDYAYVFQNPDRRIVFAIPYEGDYTLIGTTEETFEGDPGDVDISEAEIAYLCDTANRHFTQQIAPAELVWTFSGVRPLYDDAAENASAVTRDYVLDLDSSGGQAPLLSIFGGKITTYRKLAEESIALLSKPLGITAANWTAAATLPGGDMANADFNRWMTAMARTYPFLPEPLLHQYAHRYGTRMTALLGSATSLQDLGEDLGSGIHGAELAHLMEHEWALTANDVLWRRTKLGLHVSADTRRRLSDWFDRKTASATAAAKPGSP
ncbi:MAG: glycerol-3-phosphate dehydrogenase [Aquisalimonadaceae bacterium]